MSEASGQADNELLTVPTDMAREATGLFVAEGGPYEINSSRHDTLSLLDSLG